MSRFSPVHTPLNKQENLQYSTKLLIMSQSLKNKSLRTQKIIQYITKTFFPSHERNFYPHIESNLSLKTLIII